MEQHQIYIAAIFVLMFIFLVSGEITGRLALDIGDLDKLFNGKDEILIVQGTTCKNDYGCNDFGADAVCRRLIKDDPAKYCESPGKSGELCARTKDCITQVCNNGMCIGSCLVDSDCNTGKKCVMRSKTKIGDCK